MTKDDKKWIIILTLLWLTIVAIINPIGDFPLNDDWSYGKTVKGLVSEGEFRPGGWTSMPLLTQALYGSMFCHLFGFSFTTLRLSTLFLAFWGLCISFAFFRLFNVSGGLAFFCTLLIGLNPLYVCLSHTFMTDLPFAVMSMAAMYCYAKDLKSKSLPWLFLGLLFSVGATLTRQLGFFLPLAYGLSAKLSDRKWSRSFLPLFITILSLYSFELWLAQIGLPKMYMSRVTVLEGALKYGLGAFFVRFLERSGISLLYLSLLLVPMIPLTLGSLLQRVWTKAWGPLSLLGLAILALLGKRMPVGGNIIYDTGLGPITLRDVKLLNMAKWSTWPCLWYLLSIVTLLASALVLLALVAKMNELMKAGKEQEIFLFILILTYGCLIGLVYTFDRYLLVIILPVITLLLSMSETKNFPNMKMSLPSIVLLIVFGAYSVAGTHDYLSWNRIRWQILKELTESGQSSSVIDGGFEYNGYVGYDKDYKPSEGKSWWWVKDDLFILAFNPIDGYEIIKSSKFDCLLPGPKGELFLLKRKDK